MNNGCENLTINIPPYIEMSVGQGIFFPNTFKNITKIDINYITKDEIVYGLSFGKVINKKSDYSINAFLGYNILGCVITGVTYGYTNVTTIKVNKKAEPIIYQGWHSNFGMSAKFISGMTTFGAFGSSSGIGVSIGKIF